MLARDITEVDTGRVVRSMSGQTVTYTVYDEVSIVDLIDGEEQEMVSADRKYEVGQWVRLKSLNQILNSSDEIIDNYLYGSVRMKAATHAGSRIKFVESMFKHAGTMQQVDRHRPGHAYRFKGLGARFADWMIEGAIDEPSF